MNRAMTPQEFMQELRKNFSRFQTQDKHLRVYVKPYTMELVSDLEFLKNNNGKKQRVVVTEKDGTYCMTSKAVCETYQDFMLMKDSVELYLWWSKVRQYVCQPDRVVLEVNEDKRAYPKVKARWGNNDVGMAAAECDFNKTYYPARVSTSYIEPDALPLFGKAA